MLVRACNKPLDVILKNPDDSYHKVRETYEDASTLNNILGSVLSILKYNQTEPAFQENSSVVKKWRSIKSTISQKLHDKSLDGKKSIKEQKGWVDWSTVLQRQKELGRDEYGSDKHLLLSMYCLIPPARLDYNDVKIFRREPTQELTRNYLVVYTPQKMDLFLNSYKTASKYGLYRKELPLELCNIINYSLQNRPRDYLISKKSDPTKPIENKSTFQKHLSSTMKSIFKKPVTVNILRHSFISSIDYNTNTPRDLLGYAKDMHHSIEQQLFYRRYPSTDQPTPPPSTTAPVPSTAPVLSKAHVQSKAPVPSTAPVPKAPVPKAPVPKPQKSFQPERYVVL